MGYYVYRYTDKTDSIIKYVGIVYGDNRTLLQRVSEHTKDFWYEKGDWDIEYFSDNLNSRTDCEMWESHLIAKYETFKYYNSAKKDWGICSFIKNIEPKWEHFSIGVSVKKTNLMTLTEISNYISDIKGQVIIVSASPNSYKDLKKVLRKSKKKIKDIESIWDIEYAIENERSFFTTPNQLYKLCRSSFDSELWGKLRNSNIPMIICNTARAFNISNCSEQDVYNLMHSYPVEISGDKIIFKDNFRSSIFGGFKILSLFGCLKIKNDNQIEVTESTLLKPLSELCGIYQQEILYSKNNVE